VRWAHIDAQLEDQVDAAVALLPERHLADRLSSSILVIIADVIATKRTPFDVRCPRPPKRMEAWTSVKKSDATTGPIS
jgi:hypothetical protein